MLSVPLVIIILVTASLLLIPIALIILRAAGASDAAAAIVTAIPGTAAPSMATMDTAGIGTATCCRFLAKFLVVATSSPRIARERHPPTPGGRRVPRTGLVPNDAGRRGGGWLGGRDRSRSSGGIVCSRTTPTAFGIMRRRRWWHSGSSRHWHDARHRDVRQERRRAGIDRVDGHRDAAGHRCCGRLCLLLRLLLLYRYGMVGRFLRLTVFGLI